MTLMKSTFVFLLLVATMLTTFAQNLTLDARAARTAVVSPLPPVQIDGAGLLNARQEAALDAGLFLYGRVNLTLDKKAADDACARTRAARTPQQAAADRILGAVGKNGAGDTHEACSCSGAVYPCCTGQWSAGRIGVCNFNCCRTPMTVCDVY